MKKFVFLFKGFTQPTQDIMKKWMQWIKSVEDDIADMGSGFGQGLEVTKSKSIDLELDANALTAYMVFNAENINEAEKIARSCPMINSVIIYEVRSV